MDQVREGSDWDSILGNTNKEGKRSYPSFIEVYGEAQNGKRK